MLRAKLISLLGFISLLPGDGLRYGYWINEKFIDGNFDGVIKMYFVSTPNYPEKTGVLISK